MRNAGDYTPLPENENDRYKIEIYSRTENRCKKDEKGEVFAYYKGSSRLFKIYQQVPIRRVADGEIISADYNKYPLVRNIGLAALAISIMTSAGGSENTTRPIALPIISGIGGVVLLILAYKLTEQSKKNAIISLENQIRVEIDSREGAARHTGQLYTQGAKEELSSSSSSSSIPPFYQPQPQQPPTHPQGYQTAADAPPEDQEGRDYGYQEHPSPTR